MWTVERTWRQSGKVSLLTLPFNLIACNFSDPLVSMEVITADMVVVYEGYLTQLPTAVHAPHYQPQSEVLLVFA